MVPLQQDHTLEQRKKRQRLLTASQQARIRRGMIRYMQLVVDLSSAASASDFRPTRLAVMVEAVEAFIKEFFDQNPLSHLGIVLIRNGVAEILTELSSSPVRMTQPLLPPAESLRCPSPIPVPTPP